MYRIEQIAGHLAAIRRSARIVYPGSEAFHRWRRGRLWLRSFLHWRSTRLWLESCSLWPLCELVHRYPRTLERVHRPFLHVCFDAQERLTASLDHQIVVHERVPALAELLLTFGRVPIASFGVGAEKWRVSLELLEQFQKEGDWTLCVRDMRDMIVVSCTFSLVSIGGKARRPHLCVGSVQGPGTSVNGRELYRQLTKRWHGLRPKMLVVFLMQCVASALDIKFSLIVSSQAHIFSNWRYRLRRRRVYADYDRLALDSGARRRWKGWFVLPPSAGYIEQRRAFRSDSAAGGRRNALRSSLAEQIQANVRDAIRL